jgi:transketolase
LRKDAEARNRRAAGAYELLAAENGAAQVTLFASGSEVAIAVDATALAAQGIRRAWYRCRASSCWRPPIWLRAAT